MTTAAGLERRRLGSSDLDVSAIGLGGNTFGPPRLDEGETRRVVYVALDLGLNFVDTAIVCGRGRSEEFLSRTLGRRRDEVVIATKFNLAALAGESVAAHAEESLRKLRTDRIDLYQLHMSAPRLPPEEILSALDRPVASGKVRAVGACNYASWRLAEADHVARALGTVRFVSVQNYYHLLAQQIEEEIAPLCAEYGVGILPYHPLGGGFLTGKYRHGQPPPPGTREAAGSGIITAMSTDRNYTFLAELQRFATERGHTVGELAVARLLANPLIGSVITGVSNPARLKANVAAANWRLTPEETSAVDAIVSGPAGPPDPERPPSGRRRDLRSNRHRDQVGTGGNRGSRNDDAHRNRAHEETMSDGMGAGMRSGGDRPG